MLLDLTLPASWRTLLETFRPVFARNRTFGLFTLLATDLVAQTSRRTVVGMLAGAGMARLIADRLLPADARAGARRLLPRSTVAQYRDRFQPPSPWHRQTLATD